MTEDFRPTPPSEEDPTMQAAVTAANFMLRSQAPEAVDEARKLPPEAIAAIETMDAPVTTKVELLLVALGEKSASLASLQTPDELATKKGQAPPAMPAELVEGYLDAAHKAGLSVIMGPTSTMDLDRNEQSTLVELFVGGSPEQAEQLRDASLARDAKALGTALGYPETAVAGFTSGKVRASRTKGLDPRAGDFAFFTLSRDHYEDELRTAERWAGAVQQASPTLYEAYRSYKAEAARRDASTPGPQNAEQVVRLDATVEGLPKPPAEAVKFLEGANINPFVKADLLLVALGLRPAMVAEMTSEPWAAHDEPRLPDPAQTTDVILAAREFGLFVGMDEFPFDAIKDSPNKEWARATFGPDAWQTRRNIFVGNTPEALARLESAWRAGEGAESGSRAMGLALGYPSTAVEAYATGRTEPFGTGRRSLEAVAFTRFLRSSDHAQQELAVTQQWAAAVRQTSPKIYESVLSMVRASLAPSAR